jgi:hypothetical protein
MAQSGQASRTRFVASSAFARAASHRGPGSSAQSFAAARRIDARARQATEQSPAPSVETSWSISASRLAASSAQAFRGVSKARPTRIAALARLVVAPDVTRANEARLAAASNRPRSRVVPAFPGRASGAKLLA